MTTAFTAVFNGTDDVTTPAGVVTADEI